MRRSSHPPAWYPDPQDSARIRRWNGRAWTEDVRPFPDWLRTLRLSPGPPKKVRRMSTRLWVTSGLLLLLGMVLMATLGRARDEADRFSDTDFAAAANARCAATEAEVVTPNRQELTGDAEARRIDTLAGGWERMVDDLRDLPRADADAAEVDRWLAAWERWTRLGREYADALRADDDVEVADIVRRSEIEKATISRVALVNGMDDCLF